MRTVDPAISATLLRSVENENDFRMREIRQISDESDRETVKVLKKWAKR